ncbi:MAG: HAD family phosphatase [Tateyamaria sp.]|uniref:HAD family hydrolase n=1 Tax=Tateyamaria sp. TaxID=1929288 RepID=UPI00329ED5C4
MAAPAAFLFDMDGLLLDSERVYLQQALILLEPTGRSRDDIHTFFLTMVGCSGAESLARLTAYLGDATAAETFNANWHKNVAASLEQGVALRPTVRRTLAALAELGARMSVVTSTHGHRARQHLGDAGLLSFFEMVTGGDEVSHTKPHPAPYLEMAAAMGVDPSACAAFEDSDRGITSAMVAGCRGVQIPDMRPVDLPLPDLGQGVAPDLWQAVRQVDGRLGTA